MASTTSSLGVSNVQILSLKLTHKTQNFVPLLPHGIQSGSRPKAWRHGCIMVSQRSNKASIVCSGQSSLLIENEPAAIRLEEEGAQRSLSDPVSSLIPNFYEVNSLLTEICDTTSIAEFELKLNGFHLHVTRALSGGIDPPPPPTPPGSASVSANTAPEVPALNGSVATSSLAISKAGVSDGESGTLLERAADEGLVIIQSPKVGFFRRSRTIKGKRAPPSCKEKQIVKEGQVICYIEQLGGEIPVESDVSGEVTKILCEDGEPVGYGDAIIAILPSFPGIKM